MCTHGTGCGWDDDAGAAREPARDARAGREGEGGRRHAAGEAVRAHRADRAGRGRVESLSAARVGVGRGGGLRRAGGRGGRRSEEGREGREEEEEVAVLLLDTSVWIAWTSEPSRLTNKAL